MRILSMNVILVTLVCTISGCGGATADDRAPLVRAPIEAPDSIDRDIRSAGIADGSGGERLAQFIFDGGTPIPPPSGPDAGGLPFGPSDAGISPGISDSGADLPFGREAGVF